MDKHKPAANPEASTTEEPESQPNATTAEVEIEISPENAKQQVKADEQDAEVSSEVPNLKANLINLDE